MRKIGRLEEARKTFKGKQSSQTDGTKDGGDGGGGRERKKERMDNKK